MTEETKMTNFANPLFEDVDVPMCVISVGSDRYIGGLLDFDMDKGTCVVGYPLRYGEFLRHTPDGKANIDMMMEKVYAYAGLIREFAIKYDTIYFLNPENTEDEFLVKVYEERHTAIKKRDAGKIEIKGPNKIIIPGVNDIVATNQSKIK